MASSPKSRVVHVNDNVPGAVYIGRAMPYLKASPFQNTYKIGKDGTRAEVIEKYRVRTRAFVINPDAFLGGDVFVRQLHELVGKPLACWCRHDGEERTDDNACHGDVLIDLIHELGLETE